MGTSLSWKTDSQLHDAVRRQLDEDPEVSDRRVLDVAGPRHTRAHRHCARIWTTRRTVWQETGKPHHCDERRARAQGRRQAARSAEPVLGERTDELATARI